MRPLTCACVRACVYVCVCVLTSPLRKNAPSHSRFGCRSAPSAALAAAWQLACIRLKCVTDMYTDTQGVPSGTSMPGAPPIGSDVSEYCGALSGPLPPQYAALQYT